MTVFLKSTTACALLYIVFGLMAAFAAKGFAWVYLPLLVGLYIWFSRQPGRTDAECRNAFFGAIAGGIIGFILSSVLAHAIIASL